MSRHIRKGVFFMKSKYGKDLKLQVLEKGLIKEIVERKKELYFDSLIDCIDYDNGVIYKTSIDNKWFDYCIENHRKPLMDCAFLLLESKRRKAQKVREKISELVLSGKAVFLTLTFRDDVLASTSQETRRRYVARFLKKVSSQYVANIDFSPDLNREHYHAIVINRVNLNDWEYGFSSAEKVRCRKSDVKRVSLYITKLTSHALKVDATRLIYSRS